MGGSCLPRQAGSGWNVADSAIEFAAGDMMAFTQQQDQSRGELHHSSNPPACDEEHNDGDDETAASRHEPARHRSKKRNKPTLNCLACVERKSKCDRARPSCLLCAMRQTECQYTPVAHLIAATSSASSSGSHRSKRLRTTSSVDQQPVGLPADSRMPDQPFVLHHETSDHVENSVPVQRSASQPNQSSPPSFPAHDSFVLPPDLGPHPAPDGFDRMFPMTPMFTNAIETLAPIVIPSPPSSQSNPTERRALLNLFGAASTEHPFQNYWSDTGGLVEVVASLPTKADADGLIERFFDKVDPLYPVVLRDSFVADVENFWLLPDEEKHRHDPAQVALQFAVYANAAHDSSIQDGLETQFSMATFYLSCCHQSLCISNYLNRCSLITIQTMILVCHFLIASNYVADAWSISGIVQRQIYGLKLNRNPEDFGMNLDDDTIQVRLRLWQAAVSQDTLLSLALSKPPSTTHFDVDPEHLRPLSSAPPTNASSDVAYVRAMWQCATLIQETLCSPRSNQQPIAVDAAQKSQIVARFRHLQAQFEKPFCQSSATRFDKLSPRLLCQMATVSSVYFHALMLLLIEKTDKAGLHSDQYGAIHAAHEGMAAFFALVRIAPSHMHSWTAAHNRTYAMAAVIGTILSLHGKNKERAAAGDARLMVGKSDFDRYIDMLGRAQGLADFRVLQRERLANLRALQAIMIDA